MGTLLKSTCNTFLKTLEECMQIANAAFTSDLLYRTPPGSPQLAMVKSSKVRRAAQFVCNRVNLVSFSVAETNI